MADHYEPLNGGLVTNRDPAVLAPGQLYYIRNAVYKPDSQALHRARGRSAWGTVTGACDIVGLKDVKFDNGDHYLVAAASGKYITAWVTGAGATGVLDTLAISASLERLHFRNRFYLLNGVSAAGPPPTNRVMYLSATVAGTPPTMRQHGMLPVKAGPNVTTAAGTFALTVPGYYEYWTTEVAEVIQDGATAMIEGAFYGEPTTVNVSTTTIHPVIQMPLKQNSGYSTHWRVYRSTRKDAETDKKFPVGFLVATQSTATAQVEDATTQQNTGFKFPTIAGIDTWDTLTTPGNLFLDDANYCTASATTATVQQRVYGFDFGGFRGVVNGVEVEIKGRITAGAGPVQVGVAVNSKQFQFSWPEKPRVDGGTDSRYGLNRISVPGTKSGLITSVTTDQTLTLGGPNTHWTTLYDTNFTTAMGVTLYAQAPAGASLVLNYVKVKAYYGAGASDESTPFPTVVYTFGDILSQVAKNGTPPSSLVGDFYEDTLVVNDVRNPSQVRYSYPGDPEAFPETYFIDFETEENDQVRMIRTVNNRLIVGLDRSLWRLNYLPSERDASFDAGKCKEPITRSYGCVNSACCCTYSPDGSAEWLAFVSHNGVHATDGFEFKTLTRSLDWRALMPAATATPVALIDDPEMHELLFYFNDTANGVETALCLHLSYAPEHVAEGQLKISGPVHMRNYFAATTAYAPPTCALSVPRANGDTTIFLGYGGASADAGAGKVYQETGYNIPAKDPAMAFKTRRMFLAGFGQEFRLGELYGYANSYTSGQTYQYTAKTVKTNDNAGEVSKAVGYAAVSGMALHNVQMRQMCEGLSVDFAVVSGHTDLAHEFLIMRGEGFGEEDSGK